MLPEQVQEQIKTEFPIDTICSSIAFECRLQRKAAIRGAEIMIENQPSKDYQIKCIVSFIERNFSDSLAGDKFVINQLADMLYEQLTLENKK